MKNSRRNVVVCSALVTALAVTSVLLLALSPPPLRPDAASLFAVESASAFSRVFDTRVPFQSSRWRYIYVHQSKTPGGDATTLAPAGEDLGDHFVIGNGIDSGDGDIQMGPRWQQQQGAAGLKSNCVSICLVGDFDRTTPTPTQVRALEQLVQTLRGRCPVPADDVLLADQPDSAGGVGRFFPASLFRQQLQR